ncbi:MAG: class II aldolase/adducin family protein, partial [Clostridia bacterium]
IKLGFFNSFQGAFAVRADNGFLTEPDKFDHEYITSDDVIKIENGVAQNGTNPTRFAKIFEAVFAKHKDVGAVSVSSSTSAMAFAVTHAELDSKTIPESYIMMREVKRISLEDFLANPNIVAEHLCVKTPVVIVDNAFVFTAGVNITKCFDSMEVTEFTAKNIIDGLSLKNVSTIKKISSEQVAELKKEFNL